ITRHQLNALLVVRGYTKDVQDLENPSTIKLVQISEEMGRINGNVSNAKRVWLSDYRMDLAELISKTMEELEITRENEMKHHIHSLLKKTSPSNKYVLQVISLMVKLVLDQNSKMKTTLIEIKEAQLLRDERIEFLESEIVKLKQEMHHLKIKNSSNSQGLDGKNQRDTSVGELAVLLLYPDLLR
ncbi:hypothetical protein WA026_015843, partial [Henosepilachna vigintioctopunctata]